MLALAVAGLPTLIDEPVVRLNCCQGPFGDSCSRSSMVPTFPGAGATALRAFTVMVPVVGLHAKSAVSPATSSRTSLVAPTHAETFAGPAPDPVIVVRTPPGPTTVPVGVFESFVPHPLRVSVPAVVPLLKSFENRSD